MDNFFIGNIIIAVLVEINNFISFLIDDSNASYFLGSYSS